MKRNTAPWPNAWRTREAHFPSEITFVRPRRTASISLTGQQCALDCAHCGRRYLRGMITLDKAAHNPASSYLVSGGCDPQGRVPIRDDQLPRLRALRRTHRLNWHVGLIDKPLLSCIASLIDVVSFDLVGDDETIREVYGLPRSVDDYVRTYNMLRQQVKVVPHITIGLYRGQIRGEYQALELLAKHGIDDALVFIILIPTRGTRYGDCSPPLPREATQIIAEARQRFPDTPIYMGCMRPGGRYRDEVDPLAIQAGVNRMVNPAPSAVELAHELGLRVVWKEECCVF